MRQEDEHKLQEQIDAGQLPQESLKDLPLPKIPYVRDDLTNY